MKAIHNMSVPTQGTQPVKHAKGVNAPVISQETRDFVNQIFIELQAAFPAWRQAFPNNESLATAKAAWMKALVEEGITEKYQIAQGLRQARKSENEFFPSVGKFMAWCRTSSVVPDRDTAFSMLLQYTRCQYDFMPKEVKAMFDLIGRDVLRKGENGEIWRAFKRNYAFICEQLNKGNQIDQYLIQKKPKEKEPELSFEEKEERRLRILAQIQETKKKLRRKS